mmetsp:Transcript_24164/g.52615  ORF Transcript_24164/g.52615 Transcript_24164/m.52615 type:complete len:201 (+) Transcript_24164:1174-1776(+)
MRAMPRFGFGPPWISQMRSKRWRSLPFDSRPRSWRRSLRWPSWRPRAATQLQQPSRKKTKGYRPRWLLLHSQMDIHLLACPCSDPTRPHLPLVALQQVRQQAAPLGAYCLDRPLDHCSAPPTPAVAASLVAACLVQLLEVGFGANQQLRRQIHLDNLLQARQRGHYSQPCHCQAQLHPGVFSAEPPLEDCWLECRAAIGC